VHGLNSTAHTGITGTEDNFMALDATGLPKDSTSNASDFEPANANIQAHISSVANPHSTTYTQVGAEPANANIQSHISSVANPHSTTYGQVGAEPANTNIQVHIHSTSNPHSVTKTQVGLGNVPDVDTTNASNIVSGTLGGDRLPAPSASKRGGVPVLPAVPVGEVLMDDGAFGTPAGGGDMLEAN
jgi:hypothetical protein